LYKYSEIRKIQGSSNYGSYKT